MDRIEISSEQLAVIADHAVTDLPRECCGVLMGRVAAGRILVEAVVTAPNAAPQPTRGYEIDPRALVAAHRQARRSGLEVVGYYHSHPGGAAIPSRRDQVAAWMEVSYLIVATAAGEVSERRSWCLDSTGRFEEQSIQVEGETSSAAATERAA